MMGYCEKCGARTEDNVKFCPSCGAALRSASAQQSQGTGAYQGQTQEQGNARQPYSPPFNGSGVGANAPQQADARDARDNKTMAALAYILFFIPMLTGAHKTSPFVKYHTNQGAILFIAGVVYGIAVSIATRILAFIPIVGGLLSFLLSLLGFLYPILCVIGILNALNDKIKPLPVIGEVTIIK